MTTRHRVRIIAATLVGVVTLMLSACSSDEASGGTTGPSPTPTPSESMDAAEEPAVSTGRDCLIGVWLADNEFFLAAMSQFGDEIKDVSGEVTVSFAADGAMTTVYDGWLITALVDGNSSTIERDGTDVGTFSATDSTITMSDDSVGSSLTVTAAGHEMNVPPEPVSYTDAEYACSATAASITTPDGTLQLTRH